MESTIYATNQENITRLKELEFIMFFKESIYDKVKRSQLICVKPFTLRIKFRLSILGGKKTKNRLHRNLQLHNFKYRCLDSFGSSRRSLHFGIGVAINI